MATHFEIILPFGTPDAVEMGEEAFELLDALEAAADGLPRQQRDQPAQSPRLRRAGARRRSRCSVCWNWRRGFIATPKAPSTSRRERSSRRGASSEDRGACPAEEERPAALERVGMQRRRRSMPSGGRCAFSVPDWRSTSAASARATPWIAWRELLRDEWGVSRMLLHGGTSSVYARGSPPEDERGWQVAIRHPWDRQRRLARVWLRDRALGTSAATYQHLEYDGQKLGHVLDPRTGWPASGIASASVLAASAAEADALSTAFYVGGRRTRPAILCGSPRHRSHLAAGRRGRRTPRDGTFSSRIRPWLK